MRVLTVDPSKAATSMYALMLEKYPIEVLHAESAKQALAMINESYFDLIIFAYELPDSDGISFYQKISNNHPSPAQVHLLVTSNTDDAVKQAAIEQGVTACFSKYQISTLEAFVASFTKSSALKLQGHVLLVEDSHASVLIYGGALQKMGLTFDHCADAETAQTYIKTRSYDLVVSDFYLQGVGDGFSVVSAVRDSGKQNRKTPVLVISHMSTPARRFQLLLNDANDFFSKDGLLEEFEVRVAHLIANHAALKKIEQQYEAMQTLATKDALTKLYNRHYLESAKDEVIASANKANAPLSLLLVDIDYFKKVNDTHGHIFGDQLLEQLAHELKHFFADHPLIFRMGGEEFLVMLPNVSYDESIDKANRFCHHISASQLSGIHVTVSIGVASETALQPDSFERLCLEADAALYQAKHLGRNRVCAASSVVA